MTGCDFGKLHELGSGHESWQIHAQHAYLVEENVPMRRSLGQHSR